MGKGGGGQQQQQPTTQTVQQTNLPAWAQPYSEQLLGKAQALTDVNTNPYQSYTGDRLAGFTPMQQQAFQNIGGMQVSPQTGQATGLAGLAGMGSLGAGANYMNMATSPAAMQAFMSPYQQNVTDWQKQQAISDYGRQLPGLGAGASQAGAFGGTRHALVESEAQRNLQNQLAGIQAQGSQNAFNAAQQAQQFGAGLGLQGYGQATNAAQALNQFGQQQYQQQMGINAAQQQAGAQQQAMQQQQLTNQYQDFLNRQNYPYQQLAFMSDILHGTPTGGITSRQEYQAAPSMFSQIAGSLGGIGSLLGAYNKFGKEGGSVPDGLKKYAAGGLLSPTFAKGVDWEKQAAQKGIPTQLSLDDLFKLSQEKKALETAPANPQQTTVAQDLAMQVLAKTQPNMQDSGLASLPAPNLDQEQTFNAAHGGIIAFAGGGDKGEPKEDDADSIFNRMIQAESSGVHIDPKTGELLRSKAGAEGVSQLMPGTQSKPGYGVIPARDKSPEEFRRVGRDYFGAMLQKYGGDTEKAIAAYNYGPGNMDRLLSSNPDDWKTRLPGETQKYLAKVAPQPKPDYVVPQEGIASQLLSAATGSRPAYGTETAAQSDSGGKAMSQFALDRLAKEKETEETLKRNQGLMDIQRAIQKESLGYFESATPEQREISKSRVNALKNTYEYLKNYKPEAGLAATPEAKAATANAPASLPPEERDIESARLRNTQKDAMQNAADRAAKEAADRAATTAVPAAPVADSGDDQINSEIKRIITERKNYKPQTRAEAESEWQAQRKRFGIDDDFGKNQVDRLANLAAEAKKNRDVNLWLAAASGFFAMGAGKSPYALQNFAAGAGIGTKQAAEALDAYNTHQKDLVKSQYELEKAKQAERRGDFESYQRHMDKRDQMDKESEDKYFNRLTSLYGIKQRSEDLKMRQKELDASKAAALELRNRDLALKAEKEANDTWNDYVSKNAQAQILAMKADKGDVEAKAKLDNIKKEIRARAFAAAGIKQPVIDISDRDTLPAGVKVTRQ